MEKNLKNEEEPMIKMSSWAVRFQHTDKVEQKNRLKKYVLAVFGERVKKSGVPISADGIDFKEGYVLCVLKHGRNDEHRSIRYTTASPVGIPVMTVDGWCDTMDKGGLE